MGRVVGEPAGQSATYMACVKYTTEIRPVTADPIDPYVRENRAALAGLGTADSEMEAVDRRTAAALARRDLVFEQAARCWHLTSADYRALAAPDAEPAA